MNEIIEILQSGKRFTDDSRETISPKRVKEFEQRHSIELPSAYKEFVALGGLSELGFEHLVLSPDEIETATNYAPTELLPVAEDGWGNIFCFIKSKLPASPVVLWDHEARVVTDYAPTFIESLRAWRRR